MYKIGVFGFRNKVEYWVKNNMRKVEFMVVIVERSVEMVFGICGNYFLNVFIFKEK